MHKCKICKRSVPGKPNLHTVLREDGSFEKNINLCGDCYTILSHMQCGGEIPCNVTAAKVASDLIELWKL